MSSRPLPAASFDDGRHVDRHIDRWISDLREIVIGSQAGALMQVGEYLIEHVYKGVEQARSRRPDKPVAIARLAARAEEFGMTASGLTRVVPLALQGRVLGKTLSVRLGVRHHRALLAVKDPEMKRLTATAAADEGWTAEQLLRHVRKVQKPHAGGRAKIAPVKLFVDRASRVVEGTEPAALREDLDTVSPAEARRLLARVNAMQAQLERVEKLLTRLVSRGD